MDRRVGDLEKDRNAFQRTLNTATNRLMWVGIAIAVAIGLGQLTEQAALFRLVGWLLGWKAPTGLNE